MACWLVKSEPGDWSWDDQVKAKSTPWTGVKNAQAQANLRAMKKGDPVLFYHSGKEKAIVGLCEVARAPYPDPDDDTGKRVTVDLKAREPLERPVTLKAIKAEHALKDLALVRQSRLSVMPVDAQAQQKLLAMSQQAE